MIFFFLVNSDDVLSGDQCNGLPCGEIMDCIVVQFHSVKTVGCVLSESAYRQDIYT